MIRRTPLLLVSSLAMACTSTPAPSFVFDPHCACSPRNPSDTADGDHGNASAARFVFGANFPRRVVEALEATYGAPLEETVGPIIADRIPVSKYETEARAAFDQQRADAELAAARLDAELAPRFTDRLRELSFQRDAAKDEGLDDVIVLMRAQAVWSGYELAVSQLESALAATAVEAFARCASQHPIAIATGDLANGGELKLPEATTFDAVERQGLYELRLEVVIAEVRRYQTKRCRALGTKDAPAIASALVARHRPLWVALAR
jgi:hypothetical protein